MEYRQILQSSRTGHGTAPQAIQFSPPPPVSRASDGHPATPSLLFSFLLLSLTDETLNIHWLTLPPASILFHSPWRLSATCCIVIPPNPSNHSADALTREHGDASAWESTTRPDCSPLPSLLFSFLLLSLTSETLNIHWLTALPASILFHSPWRLSATFCIVISPSPSNHSADALILPPALTLSHSPGRPLGTCCRVFTPNPLKYGQCE